MTASRLTNLTDALRHANLDAVALNPCPSLIYLTGLNFHLMERPIVALFTPDGPPAIILPELEMPKVSLSPYQTQAFPYRENPAEWEDVFRQAIHSLGLEGKSIGVEPGHLRLLEFRYLQVGAPESDFPDASSVLGSLRICKEAAEVAAIQSAVQVAQEALEMTLPLVKVGMTEKELASKLTYHLLQCGSQSNLPFSPIVASGPNSAAGHATPGERPLQPGDLLVIDWGAIVNGYVSDLTRTFAVGEVESDLKQIHQIVLQANAAGRAACKPTIPTSEVDKAARAVIEAAGYGSYFPHRTGHGIGMEAHEEPYLRADNPQILESGMTFTVEPGIYLPQRGGVRIEDNVVITQRGVDVLSDIPRELRVVG